MKIHNVTGGGGVRLQVREWGNQDAPSIFFIHGWSQNHLCWKKQYESALADDCRLVALDLRGHGMSDAPLGDGNYTDPQLWADDVAAVIKQVDLGCPILVGWSYAGFIICDYLRLHGTAHVAGINFVGAAVTLNKSAFGTLIGPGFLDHVIGATDDDLPTNIEAIRNFVRGCTYSQLPAEVFEMAISWNMVVPAKVRAALLSRQIDSDDVLARIDVPVLVTQGEQDTVILPAMGRHLLSMCPAAIASWYPMTGHAPFMENPARFNSELSHFARDAQSPSAAAARGGISLGR
ncbi:MULTISPECIES: alpha/beta fold hydrolase [unclassified Rhizobium]|uniref:alpha/beta fold hydrolase n=1 Tax=unclassified Rhizobium TaxID=2613769 RepID=UPI002167AA3D|nr:MULTISPECIES: alpha/beta hydrolase [unclassified Rhizobium]MCS3744359.1 pimeloyl-ACP methyl ester carboxylesterase [Rhizobium sp. BK661]MCS4096642.1 pimeloyl-ACP methyl ester carboxylesterase [Rhizobium sp. BK176]